LLNQFFDHIKATLPKLRAADIDPGFGQDLFGGLGAACREQF